MDQTAKLNLLDEELDEASQKYIQESLEEWKESVTNHLVAQLEQEKQAKLEEIYEPIPEYNCIIGMWGQVEARAQYELLEEYCAENGLNVPEDPIFKYYRKLLAKNIIYSIS